MISLRCSALTRRGRGFFPGADYVGYVVVQAALNSTPHLVFQAVDDTSGESLRYIPSINR